MNFSCHKGSKTLRFTKVIRFVTNHSVSLCLRVFVAIVFSFFFGANSFFSFAKKNTTRQLSEIEILFHLKKIG